LAYTVGDNIKFTNSQLGFDEKIFLITTLSIATSKTKGLEVQIEAIENAENIYTWDASTTTDFTNQGESTIGGGDMAVVTGITLNPALKVFNDELSYAIDVSFDANTDPRFSHYQIKYQVVGDDSTEQTVTSASNNYTIFGLSNDTEYNVQVKAVSNSGITSSYWLGRNLHLNMPSNVYAEVGYVVKDNLNAPTQQEARDALGRDPVSGDQFYILLVDGNGNITNTTLYTFEPLLNFAYTNTALFSVDGSSGQNAFLEISLRLGALNADVTWTVETVTDNTYGEKYKIFTARNTPDLTDFHDFQTESDTVNSFPVLRISNTLPNSLWSTANEHYINSGYVRVTASWQGQSESVFVYINTEIRNT
jgi:hypothetical protein